MSQRKANKLRPLGNGRNADFSLRGRVTEIEIKDGSVFQSPTLCGQSNVSYPLQPLKPCDLN